MNKYVLQFFKRRKFSFFIAPIILVLGENCFAQKIQPYELLLTEIMSDPTPAVYLPAVEFIEVYNNSAAPIDLSSVTIHIGNKSIIPKSFQLMPDSFFVFWDEDIPTLKNGGDSIKILSGNTIIHHVYYDAYMHESKFKRNGGWSLELVDFNKPCLVKENWRSSVNLSGGSPGFLNSIKEDLTPYPIILDTYYLKNDTQLNLRFNIPIEALEIDYLNTINFDEALINIPKLDSNSTDSIFIRNVKACYEVNFEALSIKYTTPVKPKFKDLIINELLFNPDKNGSDFIEIYNSSNNAFDLSKLYFCSKNSNGELGEPFILSNSPFLFLPNKYAVFCPDKSWLSKTFTNTTNCLEVDIPPMNNDDGNIVLLTKSAEIIDEVFYHENWHYSGLKENENISLEKITPKHPNIASNWTSASSLHNYASPGYENSNFTKITSISDNFLIKNKVVTPNGDGYKDQLTIQYNLSNAHWTAKISIVNHSGITLHTINNNALLGKHGSINWNGVLQNNSIIKPGIYALSILAHNSKTLETRQEKFTFYINRKFN